MKPEAYYALAEREATHWYYRARWRAVRRLITRYVLPTAAPLRILDVGCGTGGTTAKLAALGSVVGVECDPLALRLLRARFPEIPVIQASVDGLGKCLAPEVFGLVTVLGVLYHKGVANPGVAIQQIASCLGPMGWLIWSECTYPWLRRGHDDLVQCARRFYPGEMHRLLHAAGFAIARSEHFVGWGVPVVLIEAAAYRLRKRYGLARSAESFPSGDDRPLPRWLNWLLEELTFAEWTAGQAGLRVPWGVSRLILARKVR